MNARHVALGLAFGALTLPAGASAGEWTRLTTRPVRVHGYLMTVSADRYALGSARLNVTFVGTRPSGSEQDTYSFRDAAFSARSDLRSAKLTARLGRFGRLDLKFRPRHLERSISLRAGCHATVDQVRHGVLEGSFKLKTRTRFFRTVRRHSFAARLDSTHMLRCERELVGGEFVLSATGASGSFAAAQRSSGEVAERFSISDAIPPGWWSYAFVTHTLLTRALSTFDVAQDLSSAHITGGSSYLRGSIDFAATTAPAPTQRGGTLSGALTARFDSIGTVVVSGRNFSTVSLHDCRRGCISAR
jgi:hypothetical protein